MAKLVTRYLAGYVENVVSRENGTANTPLFWSSWGRRHLGKVRQPMTGQNIWRLCKVYGRSIGYPELKPHDLRHGVAMEVYGHAQIQPAQLKESVGCYEAEALDALTSWSDKRTSGLNEFSMFIKPEATKH